MEALRTVATGDRFTMNVLVRPPFWAFWRKPRTELREYVVTAHTSGCALHNEPAYPAEPCNCGGLT